MASRDFTAMAELLNEGVGHELESLEVRGVNSLKTVDPPISALIGQRIVGVAVNEPVVEIICDSIAIRIDLARTGTVDLVDTRSASAGSPTGVLTLRSGTRFAFSEPARTKRIAFTLAAR